MSGLDLSSLQTLLLGGAGARRRWPATPPAAGSWKLWSAKMSAGRRLVEHGVRFVHLYSGTHLGDDWDNAHNDLTGSHNRMAMKTDKPIAGLLHDLKA